MLIIIISRPVYIERLNLVGHLKNLEHQSTKKSHCLTLHCGPVGRWGIWTKIEKLRDMIDKNKQWSLNYHSLVNLVPKVSWKTTNFVHWGTT